MMHSDLSMQKEFDIKRKSHDISGSASLALWANMNQSTTQLGSKRQSQGKHPLSNNRHLYMLCSHHLPSQYILFCKFFFLFCDFCAGLYLIYFFYLFFFFFFLLFIFHQDGFLACSHLALLVSLFEVFVMLYFTVCPPEVIHCVTGCSLAWTFFRIIFSWSWCQIMSNLCTFLPVGLQQIIDISRVKTLC